MRIIRQTFVILKQNPLLSTISILGTAFAITMIMAICHQLCADYPNDCHRYRYSCPQGDEGAACRSIAR